MAWIHRVMPSPSPNTLASGTFRRPDRAWYEIRSHAAGPYVLIVVAHDLPLVIAPQNPQEFIAAMDGLLATRDAPAEEPSEAFGIAEIGGAYRIIAGCTGLTVIVALPVTFAAGSFAGLAFVCMGVAGGIAAAAVWVAVRPRHFRAFPGGLRVAWTAARREYSLDEIHSVRMVSKEEVGRLSAPRNLYLLGSFGPVRSSRLGPVRTYLTRKDGMVLVERVEGEGLLISPDRPEEFVEALRKIIGQTGKTSADTQSQ
ncbi:MAG: PH domain-containing protein [Planctomycetota bacterium]